MGSFHLPVLYSFACCKTVLSNCRDGFFNQNQTSNGGPKPSVMVVYIYIYILYSRIKRSIWNHVIHVQQELNNAMQLKLDDELGVDWHGEPPYFILIWSFHCVNQGVWGVFQSGELRMVMAACHSKNSKAHEPWQPCLRDPGTLAWHIARLHGRPYFGRICGYVTTLIPRKNWPGCVAKKLYYNDGDYWGLLTIHACDIYIYIHGVNNMIILVPQKVAIRHNKMK